MNEVETRLTYILDMVIEWLKFAEAKNGGVIALSGIGLSALTTYGTSINNPTVWELATIAATYAFLLSSMGVATLSFFPKLDPLNIMSSLDEAPEDSDNLFYFGHLARLNERQLVDKIKGLFMPPSTTSVDERSELDLAEQIITNSRITRFKLRCFTVGAVLFLLGLSLGVITLGVTALA